MKRGLSFLVSGYVGLNLVLTLTMLTLTPAIYQKVVLTCF